MLKSVTKDAASTSTAADNPYPYSFGFKRYQTLDWYFKNRFGEKIAKLPLDGGFTCPNIDGRRGSGGCIYCSGRGSGDFTAEGRSVAKQICEMKKLYRGKWDVSHYIAYFQAHSNTYADTGTLRALYDEALGEDGVIGLTVATRADCIDEDIADLLASYAKKTCLSVELGLQSSNDDTARRINRCHTYEEFLRGYRLLADRGIDVCIHMINGLPGETPDDMRRTASDIALLRPHGVKIHLLYVLRGTPLFRMYEEGEFDTLTLEEYVSVVCDQLELLPPETVIERLTGDGKREDLAAPLWSLKKTVVVNEIDKELRRRDSWQGKKFSSAEKSESR